MTKAELIHQIKSKNSLLCVGLDTDINKLPDGIEKSLTGALKFNKEIIEATKEYAVSYKINTAFYEQYGSKGWDLMEATLDCIPKSCFTIADAKRGDIGNTSKMYAKAFFETMNFDSITVAPYMGEDSIKPFLEYENKWVICLALTSNQGSDDFQNLDLTTHKKLYQEVLYKASTWGNDGNTMFVTGATKAESLKEIRKIVPDHFLLVPGVGAQGGSVQDVCDNGLNREGGLLINASRSILYASKNEDYAIKAGMEAKLLQTEMSVYTSTLK